VRAIKKDFNKMFCRAAFTVTFLLVSSLSVVASQNEALSGQTAMPISAEVARAVGDANPTVSLWTLSQSPHRPAAVGVLYGTYATLQALDVVSTRKALGAGGHELNPLMNRGNVGAMLAVKAAVGVSTIYFTEKLWKKNRAGAIAVMVALNGAQAAIVAHNTRNATR
jgi:uncharacterized membrane protein